MSGQAWHKRLLASADWLLWLFNALLAAPNRSFRGQSHRILLVDATHVSCRDKRADTWRLHCAYDLLAGRLAWVRISTQHVGEAFAHLLLQVGDIVVGDGAYSRAKQLLAVATARAFCLVRYSAAHLPLYAPFAPAWTQEHRLDVPAWVRTLPPGLYERRAMVVEQQDCLPVRLIALVLPEEQAEALRRQKQRQARDKGRKLSAEALFLAGFVLLLTTLPQAQWSTEQLLELYRARWQIEIVQSQLTKTKVFAGGGGGDHVTDLHLLAGDHDAVNQQLNQLSFLFKGGFSQAKLDALAKRLNGLGHGSQLVMASHTRPAC